MFTPKHMHTHRCAQTNELTPHKHTHTQNATLQHMWAHQSGPIVHSDQGTQAGPLLPAHLCSGMPETPSGHGQRLTDELTPLKHKGNDQTQGEA